MAADAATPEDDRYEFAGPWTWDWFDASPRGETYGVRRADEVICYTNRHAQGYEDARRIADALNAAADIEPSVIRANDGTGLHRGATCMTCHGRGVM